MDHSCHGDDSDAINQGKGKLSQGALGVEGLYGLFSTRGKRESTILHHYHQGNL